MADHIEQTAQALEGALKQGRADKIDTILAQEAFNYPDQFDAICKRWQEMNQKDAQNNSLLPKVELHESGGFLGFGAHVDDVKVHTADGRTHDMYDTFEQQTQRLEQQMSRPTEQARPQEQFVMAPQNQEQVDATSPLRILSNLFKASQEGFTSKINQGYSPRTTSNHGHQLAPAGFGAWRNQ